MGRWTLSRRVAVFATLGLAGVWALATLLMAAVFWAEQEEVFDQQLVETAHVLLPLLSQARRLEGARTDLAAAHPGGDPNEVFVWRLIDREGATLLSSPFAEAPPAPGLAENGFLRSGGHRVYATAFNAAGEALVLAAPLAERREAWREGMTGFLLATLALAPLTWLFVGWLSRRALAPLESLRQEVAARGAGRLDGLEAEGWPEDLAQIVGALNGLMARLSQALEAERAFASNAAHELRTPVAAALAQVQLLREEAGADPERRARIEALERALRRMGRLVARLLQLARADAGIGASAEAHDLAPLTRLVAEDARRGAAGDRLKLSLPPHPVPARIDPDAFAIVLGNLIDNALHHGPPGAEVEIRLKPGALLEASNGGPALSPEALAGLTRRFAKGPGEGFGLGLHICAQILEQAGGRLELLSPAPGRPDGFMARISLPSG